MTFKHCVYRCMCECQRIELQVSSLLSPWGTKGLNWVIMSVCRFLQALLKRLVITWVPEKNLDTWSGDGNTLMNTQNTCWQMQALSLTMRVPPAFLSEPQSTANPNLALSHIHFRLPLKCFYKWSKIKIPSRLRCTLRLFLVTDFSVLKLGITTYSVSSFTSFLFPPKVQFHSSTTFTWSHADPHWFRYYLMKGCMSLAQENCECRKTVLHQLNNERHQKHK